MGFPQKAAVAPFDEAKLKSASTTSYRQSTKPLVWDGDNAICLHSNSDVLPDEKGNSKFVTHVVKRPVTIFCCLLVSCIAISIVLFRVAFAQGSPFTPDDHTYDLYDARSVAYDSFRLTRERVATMREMFDAGRDDDATFEDVKHPKLQENIGDITYWIFESKTAQGLLTESGLSQIRSVEQTFIDDFQYPNYCVRQYDNGLGNKTVNCRAPTSVTNIYYASNWNSTLASQISMDLTIDKIQLFNDLSPCVLKNVLCEFLPQNVTNDEKAWVRHLDFNIKSMIVHWDGKGELNRDIEQVSTYLAVLNELHVMKPFVSFYFDTNFTLEHPVAKFSRSIVYWGAPLKGAIDNETSNEKSSGELLKRFILGRHVENLNNFTKRNYSRHVQIYYYMGSLIFQVVLEILLTDGLKAVLSFLAVFLYLRFMIGSWFLAIVGMLQIFLSLPLAWFVFSFVFKIKYFSTLNVLCIFIVAAIGADDIFVFMDAYKQSAYKSMTTESLETRMNWVFRRSGLAMLITSATTCLSFLCTLVSPIAGTRSFGLFAALVIFFDYILVMTLYCSAVVIYHNKFEGSKRCCGVKTLQIGTENTGEDASFRPKDNSLYIFFRDKAAHIILRRRNRYIVGILVVTWITLCTFYASKLEPIQTAEQLLDRNHPLQKGATILNEKFPTVENDSNTKIYFIWGLSNVNRNGVRQLFNPDFVGNAVFDEKFDFTPDCQTKMMEVCDLLRTDTSLESFIKRKGGLRTVSCFVEELGAFNAIGVNSTCDDVSSGQWRSTGWQVETSNLNSTISSFIDRPTCHDTSTVAEYYSDTMGWDGTSLRYAGVSLESNILDPWSTLPEDVVRTQYDKFMSLKTKFDSTMQKVCHSELIMTDLDQKFIFMNNQKIYRKSAISGSMLGVLIAFIVLFISTRKLHVAFFATMMIACVLLSVIGSVSMMGWSIGTNEAILSSILAGFSVDYVVHLAHAYVVAHGNTESRIKEAFGEVGISVFSGMLTSVVASIPLFLCTLTFFEKFGTFLCLTIAFSWLFANFGFMSLMAHFQIPMENCRFPWL